MSEEPTPRPAREPSGNNNKMKWIAGAAAAAVLIGGGVWAVSTYGPNRTTATDTAYNAAYSPDAPADYDATAQGAAPGGDLPAADAGETETASAAPRPRRATTAARAEPAEAVIGVSPDEEASVQTASYESDEITVTPSRRPVWSRTPSARRLSNYYPERALERGREGEASLACTVEYGGALDCVRVSEYPARSGFGNAALRVARAFRHASERADGSAAEGSQVNLRVLFRLEDEPRRRARYASR